jgi:hypothetical protein
MELSKYDVAVTKENRVNKTVPMSREMSDKINILCRMLNTDFSKGTRDLWINAYLKARESGLVDRPNVIQVASESFLEDRNPFARSYKNN